MNRNYTKFICMSLHIFFCYRRFLGRVNDKGSAYKEFLIMTGISNHLAQVNFMKEFIFINIYNCLFRVGFEQFLKILHNSTKSKLKI